MMGSVLHLPLSSIEKNKSKESKSSTGLSVVDIYIDGKLKKAHLVDDKEKGFGIFMHSLILTNSARIISNGNEKLLIASDSYEKSIARYILSKGFNKPLIESLAPKVSELTLNPDKNLKASAYLINESIRLISKGSTEDLLSKCSFTLLDSKFTKLTRKSLFKINNAINIMMNKGLKVYALAVKDIEIFSKMMDIENISNHMSLVALIGIGQKDYIGTN
ncbi:MAG: hypothetical protein N3B21_02620 [Clostridia bacterium]|nr:hypothetical protein [Clostridia bacterium]